MKFKVGDKVICMTESYRIGVIGTYPFYGQTYTISGYVDTYPTLTELPGEDKLWDDHRFELANLYDRVIADRPKKEDVVNQPAHYTTGGIEVVDFIEAKNLNFRIANVVKYVVRAKHKGKELEDLKKAAWYLQREISKLEKV